MQSSPDILATLGVSSESITAELQRLETIQKLKVSKVAHFAYNYIDVIYYQPTCKIHDQFVYQVPTCMCTCSPLPSSQRVGL